MDLNINKLVSPSGNTIVTHHPKGTKNRFGAPLVKMFAAGWRFAREKEALIGSVKETL